MADPDPSATLSMFRMVARGLGRRCPLCGDRGVFESWFRMRDRCPRCNLALERVEGHWIGALGMNTVVSFGALLAVLVGGVVLAWPDPPGAGVLVACVTVAVVVPVAFFGSSRMLWSAIDLAMRPLEPHDDVDPRFIPAPRRPAGRSARRSTSPDAPVPQPPDEEPPGPAGRPSRGSTPPDAPTQKPPDA